MTGLGLLYKSLSLWRIILFLNACIHVGRSTQCCMCGQSVHGVIFLLSSQYAARSAAVSLLLGNSTTKNCWIVVNSQCEERS